MNDIILNKPFKHFDTLDTFTSSKVSVNVNNTAYIQNGTVHQGTPDILWEHTAFIHDIAQIWNRGRFYNSQKYSNKLAGIAKNIFYDYRNTIITIIDKSFTNLHDTYLNVYENYPGIIPSLVVSPSIAENNIDKLFALMDKGCDVLSTAYDNVSVYDPTATSVENYDEISNDIIQVQQWLIERGIYTNCYKYPDASKAQGESIYISKFEEYAVLESQTGLNDIKQDNMLLNGYVVNNVTSAIDYIDANISENKWIILIVDSANITGNIQSLISAINDYVDSGDAIYLQMNEAVKARGSEFNIARLSELPFKVYKDGSVDANLSYTSQEKFVFDATSYNYKEELTSYIYNKIKDDILKYNAEYLHTYMATYMHRYFLELDDPA